MQVPVSPAHGGRVAVVAARRRVAGAVAWLHDSAEVAQGSSRSHGGAGEQEPGTPEKRERPQRAVSPLAGPHKLGFLLGDALPFLEVGVLVDAV